MFREDRHIQATGGVHNSPLSRGLQPERFNIKSGLIMQRLKSITRGLQYIP